MRKVEAIPTFIDIEASSFYPDSYPIEIAWNVGDGSVSSFLISPLDVAEWTDWNQRSARVHGISREQLISEGIAPRAACDIIKDDLEGSTIYSDNPDFDSRWLCRLFAAGETAPPDIEVRSTFDVFLSLVGGGKPKLEQWELIYWAKVESRKLISQRHRAEADVKYLIECWRNLRSRSP